MDEATFKAKAQADGYTRFVERDWKAGTVNEMHTHDYGATILVLEGELTVTYEDGSATTCRTGDSNALAAGIAHAETVGPDGVRFIAGLK
jgi:quercetin dioxygenase-like cupin family protein